MQLNIQKFLRENKYCDKTKDFLDELHIDHFIEDDILHLDYSVFSDSSNEMVKECRGIGFYLDDFNLFRFGFRRFMNYGEKGQDIIDFKSKIEIEQKEDGSIIIVSYHPKHGWVIGTRGRIFPNQNINGTEYTFPELFKSTVKWDSIFEKILDKKYCYSFEICSLLNRVVVKYDNPVIYLINVFNLESLCELKTEEINEWACKLHVNRPKIYDFKNLEQILNNINTIEGYLREGFVIKQWDEENSFYKRIKIKSDEYKCLHNIFSSKSLNNLVELVILNKRSCFENGFEQFLITYDLIKNIFKKYNEEIDTLYHNTIKDIDNIKDNREKRKTFAQKVLAHQFGNICFGIIDGKFKNFEEWLMKDLANSKIKKIILDCRIDKIVGSDWAIIEDKNSDL